MESILNISSKRELLKIKDVDVESISNTLYYLCNLPLDKWEVQQVEDLSSDISRMSDRLIKKLGGQCKIAIELAYLCSKSSVDPRAPIASAVSKAQLDRVKNVLG